MSKNGLAEEEKTNDLRSKSLMTFSSEITTPVKEAAADSKITLSEQKIDYQTPVKDSA